MQGIVRHAFADTVRPLRTSRTAEGFVKGVQICAITAGDQQAFQIITGYTSNIKRFIFHS